MAKQQKSKNQLRREKAKQKKLGEQTSQSETTTPSGTTTTDQATTVPAPNGFTYTTVNQSTQRGSSHATSAPQNGATVGSLEPDMEKLLELPEFAQFRQVFDRFQTDEPVEETPGKGEIMGSDVSDVESEKDEKEQKMSKKKLRKANKIPLATLKAMSKTPENVEWYDTDAHDPLIVVELKSKKNTVPVPVNWQFKRDYLAGKRGFEKRPFELPRFISETGITDMRDTTKDDDASLKQKQRERVQVKMNRLDLDYQKLHDAFFKFQTKPKLLSYGDVYYEGRENEQMDYSQYRPGYISDELRQALGVPKGVSLPWVHKMHQLGPPPSYQDVRFPGYNSPIELENSMSFENGVSDDIEKEPFGKLLVVEESEDEEEEEEEEQDDDEGDEDAPQYVEDIEDDEEAAQSSEEADASETHQVETGVANEAGAESDDDIPLADVSFPSRDDAENQVAPQKLYQIIKENVASGKGFMGSGRSYEIPAVGATTSSKRKSSGGEQQFIKKIKTQPEGQDDDDDEEDDGGGKFKF